jgi:hypothetical protein
MVRVRAALRGASQRRFDLQRKAKDVARPVEVAATTSSGTDATRAGNADGLKPTPSAPPSVSDGATDADAALGGSAR